MAERGKDEAGSKRGGREERREGRERGRERNCWERITGSVSSKSSL
jgi:hypothetical protein